MNVKHLVIPIDGWADKAVEEVFCQAIKSARDRRDLKIAIKPFYMWYKTETILPENLL